MATHSSTLAWKMPWMEEPSGLPSDITEATWQQSQDNLLVDSTEEHWGCFQFGVITELI